LNEAGNENMTKHTHKGTCQICGRTQAVDNKRGTIAKHGYTVDWGYFSGQCEGSDELPLEVSKELTVATIARCEDRAEMLLEMTAEDVKVVVLKIREGRDYRGRPQYKTVECRNDDEVKAIEPYSTFESKQRTALLGLHSEARHLFAHARDLAGLISNRHGQELFEVKRLEEQAAAEKAEKAAKPTKASVKRIVEGLNREFSKLRDEHRSACYSADVPFYLHQYRAAKHGAAFGEDAAKVEALVEKMNEAKASLK